VRGEPRWFRLNAAPIQGPDGRPLGVLAMLTDVTALAAAERRARLLAGLGGAIAGESTASTIAERVAELTTKGLATPAAVHLCVPAMPGAAAEELVTYGADAPPLRAAAMRAIARREAVADRETLAVPLCVGDRVLGAVTLLGAFAPDDARVLEQLAAQTALVLDNARLLAETRAACEAKDAVLAVASHELMTPLTALAGYGEVLVKLLQDEAPPRSALERAAHGVQRTTERVSELSRRLLDSERIRRGQLVVERERGDLLPTLRDAVERAALAEGRGMTLDARSTALWGRWDPLRIEEAVANLISNAARYSPRETPIRIAVAIEGNELHLAVEDHGIGIPERDHARIFDAFRRGSNARFGGAGLGLGLHVAAEIFRAHGGRIWFESRLGKGTTFHVALPLE
jgi:signal transduction histidine kinase